MANPEIGTDPAVWTDTINSFREFYRQSDSSLEIAPVSLVAAHDDTIRFTNSSTSVMKPYLLGTEKMEEDRTFLVQPAMGTQGISAWRDREILGRYASYFHSMGALYPAEMGIEASEEMASIASEWGYSDSALVFLVSDRDVDIQSMLKTAEIPYQVDYDNDPSSYSHSYGSTILAGRNANLHAVGNPNPLGNLTLIERDRTPVAWEVSFDSTPIVAGLQGCQHPIDAYPHQMPIKEDIRRRVASDAAMIVAGLSLEGLQPSSRGKNGILRKFFKTYVELVELVMSTNQAATQLGEVAFTELELRQQSLAGAHLGSARAPDMDMLATWAERLSSKG